MKKKELHTYYNYQFKHTAVTVTNHPNIQAIDVADTLKIHPIMLYRWRGEMRNGKIKDNGQETRSINELMDAQKTIRRMIQLEAIIGALQRSVMPTRSNYIGNSFGVGDRSADSSKCWGAQTA